MGASTARGHAEQTAQLERPGVTFSPGDHGSLRGYAEYLAAIDAWARSPLTQQTADPGTDPQAARALEVAGGGRKVRLVLDTTTEPALAG